MTQKKTSKTKKKGALMFAAAVVGGLALTKYLYTPDGKAKAKQVKAWTIKAKAEVLEQFEKRKELSEAQYKEIVDSVTNKYAKLKTVGQTEADKLNKELKKHWKEIKKEITETVKED